MKECERCGLPTPPEKLQKLDSGEMACLNCLKETSRPVGGGYKGLLAISIVLIVVGGIICISGLISAATWLSNPHGGRGVIAGLMIAVVGFQPVGIGVVLWCLRGIAINSRKNLLDIEELRQGQECTG